MVSFVLELWTTVHDEGIAVDRIIGMHMSPTLWSMLTETLRRNGVSFSSPAFRNRTMK